MKKILFLIHDLGPGGAEKVLVNLVNNMDHTKFDITVMTIFGGGVNEQFLAKDIGLINCYKKTLRGNSHIMKLFTPKQLYRHFIKEHYDIVVSYLEGPCARIISGCDNPDIKKVAWIHSTTKSSKSLAYSFRNKREMVQSYNCFDKLVFVAKTVEETFRVACPLCIPTTVLYNTNESELIKAKAKETVQLPMADFCWCGVGKLTPNKGFDRMIRIQKRMKELGIRSHLCILGEGPQRNELEELVAQCEVSDSVTFMGFQPNPYKYVSRCDLFVCASHFEGFSTAATEALIVGTPVCTVEVSGMKEMLGENNEWGIVTENSEEALFQGIMRLIETPGLLAHYKEKAAERGKMFSTENTVKAVENMLLSL